MTHTESSGSAAHPCLAFQSPLSPAKSNVQHNHRNNDNISFQSPIPKVAGDSSKAGPGGVVTHILNGLLIRVYSINHHPSCQPSHTRNTFNLDNSLLIQTRNSRDDSTPAPHQHISLGSSRRGQREEEVQKPGGQQITGMELPSPPVYLFILPEKTPPGKSKCARNREQHDKPKMRTDLGELPKQ